MSEGPSIQHKPIRKVPAGFAFEDGALVPVVEPVVVDAAPQRELAFEIAIQKMRNIVEKNGHLESDRTEISAFLILAGRLTVIEAADLIGKDRSTILKAVVACKKELRHFSTVKTLANKGESHENDG